ncbi:MAG: patatin-like phospholipase family protein [Thermoanaerobaculia bacterium]
MSRAKSSLLLLTSLSLALMLPMSPGPVEATKSKRCEGTKKQRKQKMELRDLTDEQLEGLIERYKTIVSADREQIAQTVLRRLEREYQEHQSSGEPWVYDVLVISGGGAKGAFGAGFLEGWGALPAGPTTRPEFDVVTGVSTGALIAPFAFAGTDEAYAEVADFYAEPEPNWAHKRGELALLPHHASLFNDCHLQDMIRKKIDPALVSAVAQGAAEDRLLLIGATNLDAGRGRPFNLGEEAKAALESGSFDRVQSILLASSAIPGIFPPVEIDQMLYGDGGATSNLFLITFSGTEGPLAQFRQRHPEAPVPKTRIWVVVNEALVPQPAVTQPRWLSVSGRALDTLTKTGELFALRLIQAIVYEFRTDRGVDAEVRIVSIPQEAPQPETTEMFDKEYMIKLEDMGREMGADPSVWRTEVPSAYSFDRD